MDDAINFERNHAYLHRVGVRDEQRSHRSPPLSVLVGNALWQEMQLSHSLGIVAGRLAVYSSKKNPTRRQIQSGKHQRSSAIVVV